MIHKKCTDFRKLKYSEITQKNEDRTKARMQDRIKTKLDLMLQCMLGQH